MRIVKIILVQVIFFLSLISAAAQGFPSLDASTAAYDFAQRVTGNNWIDLAEAALWASSCDTGTEAKAVSYIERIKEAAAELAATELPDDPKNRGEYVLGFLHKKFLKSYSEHQTRIDEIFISGKYNCVSSAVLYMVLGLSVDLDIEGAMTKDHAFVSVNTGTERIDVETTNPYGFDPGNRKEFHDAFGKITGYAYTPARNYRDRAQINGAELVSLIFSNRISELERKNRFIEAVPLAINRAIFLSGNPATQNNTEIKIDFFEDPYKDMMTRLYNLGAYYLKNGKEDEAIAWAEYAGSRFSETQGNPNLSVSAENPNRWQELIHSAANNKLVKLIRTKKTPNARVVLDELKPKLTDTQFLELDAMVLEAEAAEKINNIKYAGDAQSALEFLAKYNDRLKPQRRDEMRLVAILGETDRLGKLKDWAGAIHWLNETIAQYGTNAKLEAALQTMRQNRINELHNKFAAFYNKKDFESAKTSIQQSLEEFPGDRQLLKDLELVEKAL